MPQAFLSSPSYGLTPKLDLKESDGGNDVDVAAVSCSPSLRTRQSVGSQTLQGFVVRYSTFLQMKMRENVYAKFHSRN